MTIGVASCVRRGWRLLLLAVTAVLALLVPAAPASAATSSAAETRVGACGAATAVVVGGHECITAGQRPLRGPSRPKVVYGSCVAAEAGDLASSAAQGARLQELLRMSEKYGAGGVKELSDGASGSTGL